MKNEYESYKTWIVVKKIITILFWMYVIVVIRSPETHLPDIQTFFYFYKRIVDLLIIK